MKSKIFKPLIAVFAVIVFVLILTVPTYNKLTTLEEGVNQSYAQVQNVVQRRADLIPNLVNTVKGYANHESDTLTEVTKARAGIQEAKTPSELAVANQKLTTAINVVKEAYPELKADTQFTQLMDELSGTENRISLERKRYNEEVQKYNTSLKKFPTVLIAKFTGHTNKEYFQAEEKAQDAPVVDFN